MNFSLRARLYAFLLTTFLTVAVFGADLDLRSLLPAARNQGSTNWCTSYAIADLLSARLGQPVSALSVGSNYYVYRSGFEDITLNLFSGSRGPIAFGFGLMHSVFNTNLNHKLCDQASLPDDLSAAPLAEIAAQVRTSRKDGVNHLTENCTVVEWPAPLPQIAGYDVLPTFSASKLDRVLESGAPVALTINLDSLFETSRRPSRGIAQRGFHAVTVVARRAAADGANEYLMRMSWGTRCEAVTMYKNIRGCEDGDLWVSARALRSISRSMLYLK